MDADEVDQLILQLKDKSSFVSARAAEALAAHGEADERVVPALVDALADDRIADDIPFGIPAPRRAVATFASESLVKIGKAAVKPLVEKLKTDDADLKLRVMQTLQGIGAPAQEALPSLKAIAAQGEPYTLRFVALESYASISEEPREVVALLTVALMDASPDVRGLAARQLGDLTPSAGISVEALSGMLNDQEMRWHFLSPDAATQRAVRYDAAEALGKIGAPANKALPKLQALMTKDADPEVRVAAALAIFRIDHENAEAMQSLIASLRDDSRGTAGPNEAAAALAELGPKAAPAIETLKESLTHRNTLLRIRAVRAIGAIGGEQAVALLTPVLTDRNRQVRAAAAETLGDLGPIAAPAVERLIPLLQDTDDALSFLVREATAKALGKIGPAASAAIPDLKKLAAAEDDEKLRRLALEALKLIEQDK
jgi:HEAT repeat protein